MGVYRSARLLRTLLLAAAIGCLAACLPPATDQLGPRPALDPQDAAEAYLARYQPGASPRVFQTTRIYDRHGAFLAECWEEGRRTWVPLSEVSQHLIDATVATEDATFYANAGVDPARIAGAALRNVQEGQVVSGASTITMQLARNLFLGSEQRYQQSMDRKLLEAGLAQELNSLFSKDELLEMYLNLANYGHLAYGPEAAAQVYFGKSASDLTLGEAALLAGIPQQPAALDPFSAPEAALARRQVVLGLMVRHGLLAQAEAGAVSAEPLHLAAGPAATGVGAPHFVQWVKEVLDARLGRGVACRSGLRVSTTLDLPMQDLAQGTVARMVAELHDKHNLSNAALVALRPAAEEDVAGAGEVLALVGSADFDDASISGQVNVARSLRQPGSAIKPLLYATALSDNLISPATVLWDVPVTYTVGPGLEYAPVNYDGKFHGPVTVRSALANSYNVPAVKLLDALTVPRMLQSSESFGIRSLTRGEQWYGLSLTLGGGEVTLLELTAAYAALASGGRAIMAEPILGVIDSRGRHVASASREDGVPVQAVSAAAAYLVTDILSDNAARSPMFGAHSPLLLSRPAAAKTGTTDDWRDNWTLGYTRRLVAGVWAGNSDGTPMTKVSGIVGAAPIWQAFMEAVLVDDALLSVLGAPAEPAAWEFAPPPGVERRSDCPPGLTCRAGGEYFSIEWLEAAGEAGPLADSVAVVPAAPVVVTSPDSGRWTAYCRVEPAAARAILKLPAGLGLAAGDGPADEPAPRAQLEQLHAIAWSLQHPTAVDLGPCADLAEHVAQALAIAPQAGGEGLQVTADLAAAMDPNAGPVPGDTSRPVVAAVPGDFRYALARPITHHSSCPGNYIVGQVLNRDGGPVAGVHIVMVDEWGNRADAVSKSGSGDYGRYDFPLNAFANRYSLTVVGEGGSPISAPVVVEHLQGSGADAPCHTVDWIGG